MNTPKDSSSFLEEFKQFLKFLQNLWGILAGVSMLFPLSNALAQAIPLAKWDQGGLAYFAPNLITLVSSLTCLFLILWTFGQRYQLKHQARMRLQRQAWRSFVPGLLSLVLYLMLYYAVQADFYFRVLGWESDDLRRILGDVILLMTYCAFFAMITRAFVLLGLVEFLRLER